MIDLVWTFFVVSSGKPARQVEAHLVAEHRQRAGPGAVVLAVAVLAHVAHELEIGLHRGIRRAVKGPLAGIGPPIVAERRDRAAIRSRPAHPRQAAPPIRRTAT